MYAQLCKRLSDSVSQFDGQAAQQQQTFLDVLSKVCWEKFENRFRYYQTTPPVDQPLTSDEEERQHVVKQKMLGNLKFIGELYLLGQLDDPIIHNCILQLLGNDKVSADLQVRCQDLECLCQLVRTCGKSLDAGPGGNLMDQYFAKMAKDSNKHAVYPPRIRFMLRDVIDLRDNQWVPRTAMTTQLGPMPIHLLRGSQREDDDREAASAALVAGGGEHHHYGSRRGDPFGTGSPVHGRGNDRDGSSSLYGGRGSGGGRGNDSMLSSTDLFMSKIPGFNDMFNSLSMGPTSSSSMLPPPPLMHNNRYLSGGKDGDRDHRGGGGRDRNNDYYRGGDRGEGHRGGDRDHRENKNYRNNNNSGGGNYGGGQRDGYGGRGSGGNYRDQQEAGRDRPTASSGSGNSSYQNNREDGGDRRGNDAQDGYNNGGRGDRDGDQGGSRNNNYYNNRSNSPYNRENNQGGGGGGGGNNRENNREFANNRDRDYNGMNGGNYNSNNGGGPRREDSNYHRQRNNQNYNNNSGQNGGAGGGGGGNSNYNQNNGANNRYNKHPNQNGSMNNGPGGGGGGGMYGDKKDLAPRFKRTMMGSGGPGGVGGQHGGNDRRENNNNAGQNYHNMDRQGGGGSPQNNAAGGGANNMSSSSSSASSAAGENAAGVENLQMRPAANSLLFKANTMNVNKLPLSQPQQRVIPTNSMLAAAQQSQSPQNGQAAASAGGGGGGNNNNNNYYQGRDSNPSPFKQQEPKSATLVRKEGSAAAGSQRGSLVKENSTEAMKTPEIKKLGEAQAANATPGSAGSDKDKKGKKKDKGASKEEVLKRFNAFLDEVYFKRSVTREVEEEVRVVVKKEVLVQVVAAATIENGAEKADDQAEKEPEEKNKADELESEKREGEDEVKPAEEKGADEPEPEQEAKEIEKEVEEVKPEAPVEEAPKAPEFQVVQEEEIRIEKRITTVEQDQPLEEIVRKYLDLKVPDKFVKDCLAQLYTVSLDKEVAEAENEPRNLSKEILAADLSPAAVACCFWQLSPVERCVVFVDELKRHAKLGNNVAESLKQTVQQVAQDTPKVLPWLTKLLGSAIVAKAYGIQELAALADNGRYHPLVLDTLQRLSRDSAAVEEGKKRLLELFVAAKVDLLQTLPEAERNKEQLVAVLDERQLDFLCPLLKVQSQMWKQIKADANPQQFYKWIKENVDAAYFADEGFIQALVTVLLKHITQETTLPEGSDQTKNPDKALIEKEKQSLEKFCAVLNAFLTSAKLQLIAIYALQVYCHSVDFPKGMLLRWFTALYDLNVCEEEAFLQWKEDLTDAYPGKQRALFQVNTWLMWLQEAESEEEEEN